MHASIFNQKLEGSFTILKLTFSFCFPVNTEIFLITARIVTLASVNQDPLSKGWTSAAKPTMMSLTENESRIGFIGIGIMGKGMATNLVAKGHHRLLVWNRSVEVAQTFAAKTNETYGTGTVIVADSVEGLMKECDVVYSMLSTLEASEAVFPHIIDGLRQRPASSRIPILIDCATLTVERFQAMHKQLEYEGRTLAHFVEAPVSGSKLPAEQGQLIFLVSGHKESATQTCAADFNAMGKRTFFLARRSVKEHR